MARPLRWALLVAFWAIIVPPPVYLQTSQSDACTGPPAERSECGYAGITQAQCLAKGCCYRTSTHNAKWCFHKFSSECAVKPQDRQQCGVSTTNSSDCKNLKCCFQSDIAGKGIPFCYLPSPTHPGQRQSRSRGRVRLHSPRRHAPTTHVDPAPLEEESTELTPFQLHPLRRHSDVCHTTKEHRFDCGNNGISQTACLNKNCCYDAMPNHKYCYYSISDIKAKIQTDCTNIKYLASTLDIAFVFDNGGTISNSGKYIAAISDLMSMLMDHTTYSPDLVRPAIGTFSASFTSQLAFNNDAGQHETETGSTLTNMKNEVSGTTSSLAVGLRAILHLFTDSGGFQRTGVTRIAVMYITSSTKVNVYMTYALRQILKSHDIELVFVDYYGIATQKAFIQTIFPAQTYRYVDSADQSTLIKVLCGVLKAWKTRQDTLASSLTTVTAEFGGVFYRLQQDAAQTLVRLSTISTTGFIQSLKLEAASSGTLNILVMRTYGGKLYTVARISLRIRVLGIQTIYLKVLIGVKAGDRIALYSRDNALPIPYDSCNASKNTKILQRLLNVSLGSHYDFSAAPFMCRDYSLSINIVTQYATWRVYGSRSLVLAAGSTSYQLSSIRTLADCRSRCINHPSFACRAVEYANDGSNVCRLLSTTYLSGLSKWKTTIFKFDYSEWTARAVGTPAPPTTGNVGSSVVTFAPNIARYVFDYSIIIFRDLKFEFDTRVSSWDVRAIRAGAVYVCVWRWLSKYSTYTLIGKDVVVFIGSGLKQVTSSGIDARRGDVIGLASVGGGSAMVVEIGQPNNADEGSGIYAAFADITVMGTGQHVSGYVLPLRGLPTMQAVSAATSVTVARRTPGASLYFITYSTTKSVIADTVTGGPGGSLNVYTAKNSSNNEITYIKVTLVSRAALTKAGTAGSVVLQFTPYNKHGYINTVMDIFVEGSLTSPICRMSTTLTPVSSRVRLEIHYQDFRGVYRAAITDAGHVSSLGAWVTFAVLTGINGRAETVYINGKKFTPVAVTTTILPGYTIVNSMASMGELVAGLRTFKSSLSQTDIAAFAVLKSPFPMANMLPRVRVTTLSSGVSTYRATVNLVQGKRVAYKVVWRDATTRKILFEDLVVIRPTHLELTYTFDFPSTASATTTPSSGVTIEVLTCEPTECDRVVSGPQVSPPLIRRFSIVDSNGITVGRFPSMLSIMEGSSVTYTVRLSAPAYLFCDASTKGCIVQLHTIVSPARGGKAIKCALITTNISQIAIGSPGSQKATCRMLFVENSAGEYELPVTIYAFPDGIINEVASTANHEVTTSLYVDGKFYMDVFKTKVNVKDNILWPSPCIVRQFGDIIAFSKTRKYVLAEGEYMVFNDNGVGATEKVHMAFREFSNGDQAPTACAAFIQCGDNVVSFDKCGPTKSGQSSYPGTVRLYQNGGLDVGFSILRSNTGWQYNVIFPSLNMVHIDFTGHLAVTVRTTAPTTQQVSGLCHNDVATAANRVTTSIAFGVVHGTGSSPLRHRFSRCETDKDSSVTSLSGLGCELTYAHDVTQALEPVACALVPINERGDCGFSGITQGTCSGKGCCWNPSVPGFKWCFHTEAGPTMLYGSLIHLHPWATQLKRAAYETGTKTYAGLTSSMTWSTSGVTESTATTKCNTVITALNTYCNGSALPSSTVALDMCLRDIKARGDLSEAYSAGMELRRLCMNRIFGEYTLNYIDDPNNANGPKMIVERFLRLVSQDCPNDCSGKGNCVRTQCLCNTGFGGIDCTLNSIIPIVTEPDPFRECDIAQFHCDKPYFNGMNFKGSSTLYLLKGAGVDTGRDDTQDSKVLFASATSVGITISGSDTRTIFDVYFKADSSATQYSTAYRYILWDSRCSQISSTTGALTPLGNVCRIGNRCWKPGTVSGANRKEMCRPSVSGNSWTTVADVQPANFTAAFDGGLWGKGATALAALKISTTPTTLSKPLFKSYRTHPHYPVLTIGTPGTITSLSINVSKTIREATSLTLILQIRPDRDPTHDHSALLSFHTPGRPPGLSMFIQHGVTITTFQASMGAKRLTGNLIADAWNVIAIVFNTFSGHFNLYINGVQSGSSVDIDVISPDVDYTYLTISDPSTPFEGSLYGMQIFTEPLTLATLSLLAKETLSSYPDPPTPLPTVVFSKAGVFEVSLTFNTKTAYMIITWIFGSSRSSALKVTTSTTVSYPGTQPRLGISGTVSLRIESCTSKGECNTPVETSLSNDLKFPFPAAETFPGSPFVSGLENLPVYKFTVNGGSSVDIALTLPVRPSGLCAPGCVVSVLAYRIPGKKSGITCLGSSAEIPVVFIDSPSNGTQCGMPVSDTGLVTMTLYAPRSPIITSVNQTVTMALAVSITEGTVNSQKVIAMTELTVTKPAGQTNGVPVCSLLFGRYVFTFDKEFFAVKVEGSRRMYAFGKTEEVQTYHRMCPKTTKAVCTCGVSVRYKDTVFTMNRGCELDKRQNAPLINQIYSTGKTADIKLRVITQSPDVYSILMPKGTRVDLRIEEESISVSIYARQDIYKLTSPNDLIGYCGNFDNSVTADSSLNIGQNEVLVDQDQIKGCAKYSPTKPPPNRCDCTDRNRPGGPGVGPSCGIDDPLPCVRGTDITGRLHYHNNKGRCFITKLHFSYTTSFTSPVDIVLILDANIQTVIKASAVYQAYLKTSITSKMSLDNLVQLASAELIVNCSPSSMASNCRQLNYVGNLGDVIQNCLSCLKNLASSVSVSMSAGGVARFALQLVQQELEVHSLTLAELRVTDPILGLSTVSLLKDLCPNDCSGHGICSDGTCTCGTGFSGDDCNTIPTDRPTLLLADEPQCCDGTTSSCTDIPVVGIGFENTQALICRVQRYTVSGSSEQRKPAIFVDSRMVICSVTSTGFSYLKISISNDGIIFSSTSITMYLPGSTPPCLTCGTPGVHLKARHCLIGGKCYMNFDKNSNGEVCYDYLSKTSWSIFKDPCGDLDKTDRIDCGYSNVDSVTCMTGNICCYDEVPNYPHCHFKAHVRKEHLKENPMCPQNPNIKPCPGVGQSATEQLCHYMKCCFLGAGQCFEYTGPPPDIPRPRGCPKTVDPTLALEACGTSTIEKNDCHTLGCCYNVSTTQPTCYKIPPKPTQPEACPATYVPSAKRRPCGSALTTADADERCYRLGCCYDLQGVHPRCYSIPECFPDLQVKKLNFDADAQMVIFVDVKTSCSGYLSNISLFAVSTGEMWIDLYEETGASAYTLVLSMRVVLGAVGLYTFSPISVNGNRVLVKGGLVLGVHAKTASDSVHISYAQYPYGGFTNTGYVTSDLSRQLRSQLYHVDLPIGKEVTGTIDATILRLPALKLHILPLPGRCGLEPADRRDCGYSGITEKECHEVKNDQGEELCCFDGKIGAHYHCFFAEDIDESPRPDKCPAVDVGYLRKPCGTDPINREVCHSYGCCFDSSSNMRDCYKIPDSKRPKECPKKSSLNYKREPCGNNTMDEISCHLKYCCFDKSDDEPDCYIIPVGPQVGTPDPPDEPDRPSPVVRGAEARVPSRLRQLPTGLIVKVGVIPEDTVKVTTWRLDAAVVQREVLKHENEGDVTYFDFGWRSMKDNPEMKVCMCSSYEGSTELSEEVCSKSWRALDAEVEGDDLEVAEGEIVTLNFEMEGFPGLLCAGSAGYSGYTLEVSLVSEDPPERSCGPSLENIPQVSFSKDGKGKSEDCHRTYPVIDQTFVSIKWDLKMTGLLDNRVEGETSVMVNIRVTKSVYGSEFCTVNAGEFKVKVSDTTPNNTQCIVGYPFNVNQFDGTSFPSNMAGTFVMVRHATLPFEAHIITKVVTQGPADTSPPIAVVCAVALRVGKNVIVLSMCGDVEDKMASTVDIKVQLKTPFIPGSLALKRKGDNFVMITPLGGTIFISTGEVGTRAFFNLIYSPASGDYGAMLGMCGSYDGSAYQGPVLTVSQGNRAANQHRVTQNENIFKQDDSFDLTSKRWCNCAASLTGVNCLNSPYERCESSLSLIDIGDFVDGSISAEVIRAWTDPDNKQPVGPLFPTFPTTNGFTENQAKSYCVDKIYNTKVGSICSTILPKLYSAARDQCIGLIGRTGGTNITAIIIQGLKSACLVAAAQFPKLPPGLVSISGLVCLNDCGDHGYCYFGTCQCYSGYSGPSCALPPNVPPMVTGLVGESTCTLSPNNLCNFITITGTFNPAMNYTCKVIYIDPLSRNIKYVSTYPASMVLSRQLTCPLPGGDSALVTIIDSARRSSPEPVACLVINPNCLDCKVTGLSDYSCKQRKYGCYIYGMCQKPDTVYSAKHRCYYCNPARNASGWSIRDDLEKCRVPEAPTPRLLLGPNTFLLLVLFTVLLGLVVIAMCCFVCCRCCMCCRCWKVSSAPTCGETTSECTTECTGECTCNSDEQCLYTRGPYGNGNSTWGVYAMRDQHWGYDDHCQPCTYDNKATCNS